MVDPYEPNHVIFLPTEEEEKEYLKRRHQEMKAIQAARAKEIQRARDYAWIKQGIKLNQH